MGNRTFPEWEYEKRKASEERVRKGRNFSHVVLSVEQDGAATIGDLRRRLGLNREDAEIALRSAIDYGLIKEIKKDYGVLYALNRG